MVPGKIGPYRLGEAHRDDLRRQHGAGVADKRLPGRLRRSGSSRVAPDAGPASTAAAAKRCYEAVYRLPHVQGWLGQNTSPEGYDLYCYPSKTLSSMIQALATYAENATAEDAAKALAICRIDGGLHRRVCGGVPRDRRRPLSRKGQGRNASSPGFSSSALSEARVVCVELSSATENGT